MPKKRTGLSDMDKRIIRLMAKHSMCLAAVADEMHYHGNTVRYHVDIIRRDTGKDASQFYDLVSLLHDLGDMPTIDAVPVVRCKDCKYFQDNNSGYPNDECRWGKGETPDPDDFCSYGERRDGEG